jgi:transcriptional regulator with XRE-family HTH domain
MSHAYLNNRRAQRARRMAGLNVSQAAKRLELEASALRNFESGSWSLDATSAYITYMADTYGVSRDYLLGYELVLRPKLAALIDRSLMSEDDKLKLIEVLLSKEVRR